MNRNLAAILIFFTVISGVIARAEFITDFDLKGLVRIFDFTLFSILFILNFNNIKIKMIELLMLFFSFISLFLVFKDDLVNFIYIIVFIITIRNLFDFKKMIDILLVSTVISLVFVFIFCVFGITDGIVWIESAKGSYISHDLSLLFNKPDGYRVRFAFGMNHPNSFSIILLSLISLVFLYKKSFGLFILNLLLATLTYYFTDSKYIVLYTIFLYIFYVLFSYVKFDKLKYTPAFLFIFSLFLTVFMEDTILNNILSGRLRLWDNLVSDTSLKDWILGKSIEDFAIDNGYWHLLFGGGILLVIYVVRVASSFLNNIMQRRHLRLLVFVITFLVFNVVEEYFLRFENPTTILFWWLLLTDVSKIDAGRSFNDLDNAGINSQSAA